MDLCHGCLSGPPFHHTPHCPLCGLPRANHRIYAAFIASTPDFDLTCALFRYEYPASQLLQHYKYNHQLDLAETFAKLLIQNISEKNISKQDLPDLLIPMPLHPKRPRERGFNQSLEIAKIINKRLNIQLNYTACTRIKYTQPQASLPLKERANNIKGAFKCARPLTGLRIALIDDVMTTGASLNALAKAVKAKGASHVECWVIARTLLD